ncbi:MAG: hypothetical protein DSZ31_04680 [Gammaproteobacteria bacterium]|nr:MAG: hypothetical protein DSZ31_04680 [Gammaproteobacteria bacterium]
MNKGKPYEDTACKYLTQRGYEILFRNWHSKFGEIDIVALKGKKLVIAEVKGSQKGFPLWRVDCKKVKKIYLTYLSLLETYPELEGFEVVFLTLTVSKKRVKEIKIVLDDCINHLQ